MLVVVLSSAGLMLFCESRLLFRSNMMKGSIEKAFFTLMVIASLAFWWKSGPNPRFAYGVLFFFLTLSIALSFVRFKLGSWLRYAPLVGLVPLLMMTRTILSESEPKRPVEFSVMAGKSGNIYYPKTSDKCWDHALPCADMDRPALQFRGTTLEQGFVTY